MFITVVCAFMAVPAMADLYVNVPGTSCPYFAGQSQPALQTAYPPTPPYVPEGGTHANFHNDTLASAGTIPPFVDVSGWEAAGVKLSITATGTWGHWGPGQSGPDGYDAYYPTHDEYDDLGISRVLNTRVNTLLGVFLTDVAPSLPAPASLTFGDVMTSPLLQQTFVIGSSLQNITIPSDATRLFFGLNNGYEWNNNVGSVDVTVVPLPAGVLLGMLGLSAAGIKLRKFA